MKTRLASIVLFCGLVPSPAAAQSRTVADSVKRDTVQLRERWEYRIEKGTSDTAKMNALGRQGWE